ncbi:MAG: competence/damage-inducible protein A [Chloroflexi bacterium]|nr:competence/damage-inducible protein A [Chloroflexota bacterium]
MKAEIVSVGTEILLGEITDTNSSYLAGQLPLLGIDLYWVSTVGDNRNRIVEVLKRAWGRSDLILVTGGLGPTEDDLTRESIAQTLGEEMKVDAALEKWLRDFFASRRFAMPERNLKQATLIPSAQALPNPRGTAPGWWVERDGRILASMPGPPAEMQRMWQFEVLPRLRPRLTGEIILSRTLKNYGLGEATVDEMLSPLLSSTNPSIGIYAKPDGIHARITAKGKTREEVQPLLDEMEAKSRRILGKYVWGVDDETLEVVVGNLLKRRKLTLATMESCTGGLLASTITDVPGSSAYFKGGIVSYSNEAKTANGVDAALIDKYGAVSHEVAAAMATAVKTRLSADIGIGVTGVLGPDTLEGKPVGTVHIAVDAPGRSEVYPRNLNFPRLQAKRLATTAALFNLRAILLDMG